LTFKLVAKTDDALKPDVIKWSAFYEHRIKLGSVSFENSTLIFWENKIEYLLKTYSVESHFPPGSLRGEIHAYL